jgi:hypothetical protein
VVASSFETHRFAMTVPHDGHVADMPKSTSPEAKVGGQICCAAQRGQSMSALSKGTSDINFAVELNRKNIPLTAGCKDADPLGRG